MLVHGSGILEHDPVGLRLIYMINSIVILSLKTELIYALYTKNHGCSPGWKSFSNSCAICWYIWVDGEFFV